MTALSQTNQYLNTHYEGMSREQLILMLYKGALERIRLTRQGIEENNIGKRGENLSRVIAIISELNASIDTRINDEGIQFLRGLYRAILAELPKVSLTNDVKILDRTEAYIIKLKEIWEKDVMGKNNNVLSELHSFAKKNPVPSPYGGGETVNRLNSFAV